MAKVLKIYRVIKSSTEGKFYVGWALPTIIP